MPTLHFKGKTAVETHHHVVPHHTLEFDEKLSVLGEGRSPSLDGNLIIEGDNLLALKALLPTHAGKVKCVYIDPPYNTGNEGWVYNDNLTQPQFKEWIGRTVGKEGEDFCRHDKWCCMMYPRLQLLKELLADDGILMVSIDDHEAPNLRLMLDEVFGNGSPGDTDANFMGVLTWKTRNTDNRLKSRFSVDHEYVFVYRKSPVGAWHGRVIDRSDFSNPDNDPRGPWVSDPLTGKATAEARPNLHHVVINPDTGDRFEPDPSRGWITDRGGMKVLIDEGRIWWPPDPHTGKPRKKRYLSETSERMPESSFWADVKGQSGADELDQILGKRLFDFPKLEAFVRRLLDVACANDALILDSSVGSGTTAHAALELNKADGGSRRFILVQQPYDTKQHEKDKFNICRKVTRERVKKVAGGYSYAKPKRGGGSERIKVDGTGGSFTYTRLSEKPLFGDYRDLGDEPPGYDEIAAYVFYTETSEQWKGSDRRKNKAFDRETGRIGVHGRTSYYLLYEPNDRLDRGLDAGFLRTMLEHAVSRRIELWEKTDIVRMTPAQLRECLNILIVQLASTNRQTREQLKFFKDSGGNITMHFPPEDEPEAHRELRERFGNLEMVEDDEQTGRHLVKTSVGNLVRMCRPAVVLDEGHKATSTLAQDTIRGFNASIVMELSATPRAEASIVARASGEELLDEEMIKLPLNIAVSGARDWKDVLTRAKDKREALAKAAARLVETGESDRLIRPIVLVQVERTGKDQRGGGHIHAEDVREHLVQRLGVPGGAIAVKSTDKDEIEKIDLMDSDCPVCWIITKAALQEGWDCPFAYILASLDNTGNERAMTQLIGRVLRQPFQERTPDESLNQSYVYCLRATAGQIARQVKSALEKEGYEGDLAAQMVQDAGSGGEPVTREAKIRPEFASLYHRRFEGKVYLPRFCVREGEGVVPLDYFRHLLGRVDVEEFAYDSIDWKLDDALAEAKDRFYSVSLGEDLQRTHDRDAELLENDAQVRAWLVASLPFDYLSFKQLRVIARRVYERLCAGEPNLDGRFALVKFAVREKIERFIREQIDRQTEAAFKTIFDEDRLCFYLECAECRFEVPPSVQIKSMRGLAHDDGKEIKKSLFDYVDDEAHNKYERAIALCLDRQANVLWWYRNLVGADQFAIQGYRRERIYPDFVVKRDDVTEKEIHDVLVLESKGAHLEGNPDTRYKRNVTSYFEKVGRRVSWQQLGEDFKDHQFRFQILDEADENGRDWREGLSEMLTAEA